MSTWIEFGTRADAVAFARSVDTALGYPRRGVIVGKVIAIPEWDGTGEPPIGWISGYRSPLARSGVWGYQVDETNARVISAATVERTNEYDGATVVRHNTARTIVPISLDDAYALARSNGRGGARRSARSFGA